jgi:hypothetical protein
MIRPSGATLAPFSAAEKPQLFSGDGVIFISNDSQVN